MRNNKYNVFNLFNFLWVQWRCFGLSWGSGASASPSFALPMFITIKKIIILHLFLGVPAATVGGTGHTLAHPWLRP